MLPESGLSAFIQTKCPLNSDPKWRLEVGSFLLLLTVMFTFGVQLTFTNYQQCLLFGLRLCILPEQGKTF